MLGHTACNQTLIGAASKRGLSTDKEEEELDLPPDMTLVAGSPSMALSTNCCTASKLASFINPELRIIPAPAGIALLASPDMCQSSWVHSLVYLALTKDTSLPDTSCPSPGSVGSRDSALEQSEPRRKYQTSRCVGCLGFKMAHSNKL